MPVETVTWIESIARSPNYSRHRGGRLKLLSGGSSDSACGLQAGGYGSDDLLVDFIDGVVAFNEDYAMLLPQCDFAVFFPDAGVEGILLRLEAIFILAVLRLDTLIAAAGADERRLEAR